MFERLLDKNTKPTIDELTQYCGENGKRFSALNTTLSTQYGTTQEIRFPYGNKYGWCITHRKGKKLICDIFAESGAFSVMVKLSAKHFEPLYDNLLEYTQKYISNCYPCGDGGWIHYRVLCDEHQNDILLLLHKKCANQSAKPKQE